MVLKHDSEATLLQASKQYDAALKEQDLDKLDSIVTENYTIHADGITLKADLKGINEAKNYWQAYFDKYTFEHEVLAGAVDKEAIVAFSFWLDKNVTPKDAAVFDEKVSSKDTLPSHTLGIFKHEFGSDGKIKDTWFLRQFSKDEAARKLKNAPDFTKVKVNAPIYKGSGGIEPSEERSQKQDQAASAYAQIWSTGDPSAADAVMAEDVRFVDLLFEQETNGREEFKKMIHSVFKSWKSEQQDRTTVAVSAGNKAFIHWSSTGTEKKEGLTTKMYGLEMLVFNEQCQVSEILVLRQPLESQKAELFGSAEE
ncbi:hypothetical protein ABBQ38_001228 [Trebouxia sp. C0009 RCD-2024]